MFFFFQKNLDIKNLDVKKINRTSISQPYSGVLLGYIQELQIWRSIVTAKILLVSRYGVFYDFFIIKKKKK